MDNNFYIGLDIGSNSLGWAATTEDYSLLRLNGKTAFGSRIFSDAKDCKSRRTFRANRRRMQRRKYRIKLLNELFAEEISKVDRNFFARLSMSTYLEEDKGELGKYILFTNREDEINFYKEYPTIWHLRKALVEGDKKTFSNIKYIYLALHHIIKYRGNFLNDGKMEFNELDSSIFSRLNECLKVLAVNDDGEVSDEDFIVNDCKENFISILTNNNYNKKTKQKELKKLFSVPVELQNLIEMFVNIATGGEYKLSKIDKSYEGSIDFKSNFEDNASSIAAYLKEAFELVLIAKSVFDYIELKDLLDGECNISSVMVKIHEEHKEDLKLLKKVIINIDKKLNITDENRLYNKVFKVDKNGECNYVTLIGKNANNESSIATRCNITDFHKYIKPILIQYKEHINAEDYKYILDKIEQGKFLRIISNVSTSLIPHQLHEVELEQILLNAEEYYPFIKTIHDKLLKLFIFRVPYYFGPLNSNSKYSNVARLSNEIVTPWNYKDIIDDNKTRVNFMKKLTNQCRFLAGSKVLPKSSLLYEEFIILDRLNAMKINGNALDQDTKDRLVQFIKEKNKTTITAIKRFLSNGKKDEVLITGINIENPFEASSHALLMQCFDLKKDNSLLEEIILLSTVYADDKKILLEVIQDKYPHLTNNQLNCIKRLQCKKWAPLSKDLLDGISSLDEIGNSYTIIEVMRNTNKNFQMVLNDELFNFNTIINEKNKELEGEKTVNKIVEEMLNETPAMMRRSINQAILVIDDIISLTKKDPEKIFIEVTREDLKNKKKKTTDSRRVELSRFINDFIKSVKELKNEYLLEVGQRVLQELNTTEDIALKGKHVYLYFKQLGIDMYTGKRINLGEVLKANKYDIDHIIPQSIIKDDSLDNMVLVDKEYNQRLKKDEYPLPEKIRTQENIKHWSFLYKKGFISEKKYNNLIREKEITLDELQDFVARQINVVNYSNIVVRNILNIKYPNTTVVFSKAQYPSFIRQHLQITKVRELNDAHHAIDAYLNVVSGNILYNRFNNVRYLYEEKKYSDEKSFNMINVLKYYLKKDDLYLKVKSNCLRHDALVTYKTEFENGSLYKQTMYKKGSSNNLIPIHTKGPMSDVSKYGGYSDLTSNSLCLIEYESKGKIFKRFESVKTLYKKLYENNKEELLKFIYNDEKLSNLRLLKIIPLNQKIQYDGGIYRIWTNNENVNKLKQAYQNYVDNDLLIYYNICVHHLEKNKDLLSANQDIIEIETNRKGDKIIISKEGNYKLFSSLIENVFNKIYNSCPYICALRNIEDKERYMQFSIVDQITINMEVIKVLSSTEYPSSLNKYYSEVLANSRLLVSKNITNKKIFLIHESPSGLYSRKEEI